VTTIHKLQVSEYSALVIPLTTQHYITLAHKLVYTALTRGKRLVVIVGQRKAEASRAVAPRIAAGERSWRTKRSAEGIWPDNFRSQKSL
jgi:exodeoxyribonuclease V alpha subunit